MGEKKDKNNPKKIFREQDDLVVSREKMPGSADGLTSIRHSEIASIVPDDMNWNNIYFGRQHGLHSTKPGEDSKKKELP